MKVFDRRARVARQSFVWQKDRGVWHRHLVRRLQHGDAYWSRLVHVRPDEWVCLACLSQNVEVRQSPTYQDGLLHCRDCGVCYGIV